MRSKPRELAVHLPLSPHKYLKHSPSSAHFYGNFSRANSFSELAVQTRLKIMKTKACGWAGRRSNKSENMETGFEKWQKSVDSKSVTLIGKSSETLDFRRSITKVWNERDTLWLAVITWTSLGMDVRHRRSGFRWSTPRLRACVRRETLHSAFLLPDAIERTMGRAIILENHAGGQRNCHSIAFWRQNTPTAWKLWGETENSFQRKWNLKNDNLAEVQWLVANCRLQDSSVLLCMGSVKMKLQLPCFCHNGDNWLVCLSTWINYVAIF